MNGKGEREKGNREKEKGKGRRGSTWREGGGGYLEGRQEKESEKEKELGSRREKFRGSLQFNLLKYN